MDIEANLIKIVGKENVCINEDMSKHTTFKTGGKADFFVKIKELDGLVHILEFSKNNNLPLFVLGNGSNILVRDKGIRGIICKIDIQKFEIEEKGNDIFITIGSGDKNTIIAQKLLNLQIEGFEFASRNPRNYSAEL